MLNHDRTNWQHEAALDEVAKHHNSAGLAQAHREGPGKNLPESIAVVDAGVLTLPAFEADYVVRCGPVIAGSACNYSVATASPSRSLPPSSTSPVHLCALAQAKNLPVIIRSATTGTPAASLWQQDSYLLDRVGHARVRVRTAPSAGATFGSAERLQDGETQLYEHTELTVAEFLSALTRSGAPLYYAARLELQVISRL